MDIFINFTLKWWQAGLFKLGMMSWGLLLGTLAQTFWPTFLATFWPLFAVLFVGSTGYVTWVWWKQ